MDLKCTEDELVRVRTALSEATAAVIAACEKSDQSTPSTPQSANLPQTSVTMPDVSIHFNMNFSFNINKATMFVY